MRGLGDKSPAGRGQGWGGARGEDVAEVAGGGKEGLHTREDHQDREKEGEVEREKGRGGSAQQGEGSREGSTKGWMQTAQG